MLQSTKLEETSNFLYLDLVSSYVYVIRDKKNYIHNIKIPSCGQFITAW